jgi:ubiquinol-cytochrome c reductase subunit 7
MQLSIMKQILPKEEWVQWEDDITKGRYLQPYLDEVIAERTEKETWAKKV